MIKAKLEPISLNKGKNFGKYISSYFDNNPTMFNTLIEVSQKPY